MNTAMRPLLAAVAAVIPYCASAQYALTVVHADYEGCTGGYEYIDLTKKVLPPWLPQRGLVSDARIVHQGIGNNSGQFLIGIDKYRQSWRSATNGAVSFEDGDNTRWTPLASAWGFPGNPQEDVRSRAAPVLFDQETDSLWVKYGCGSWDIAGWEFSFAPYSGALIEPPGYRPATIIRMAEQFTNQSNGWNGYAIATVVAESAVRGPFGPPSFGKFAFALQATVAEVMAVNAAYFCAQAPAGNPWDCASAPVQMTSGGAASFNVAANTRKSVDEFQFAWTGGNVVIRLLIGNNGANSPLLFNANPYVTRYFKSGATVADVSAITPTGYGAGAAFNLGLAWMAAGP